MRLEFHELIASDISAVMDYYEDVAGQQFADEFYAELQSFFLKAADSPESYNNIRWCLAFDSAILFDGSLGKTDRMRAPWPDNRASESKAVSIV